MDCIKLIKSLNYKKFLSQNFLNMNNIPRYLQKYVVEQNYEQYTPIDHACWRFIMRINESYFAKNAHRKYLEGLNKTGITIDKIPKISDINAKMNEFGWSAIGVKGFLPPIIFMDFQSKAILPIACEMRSIKHLTYTPAPDIVHEAAGHSPMIADKDYANFLKNYGQIALKAISSEEDYELYKSIRYLSEIKENPKSKEAEILDAEIDVKKKKEAISYTSEASYLSRINWWTVEYGLIGKVESPKIYGAGLLSSIGESENCLKNSVEKIPISIDCINHSYDITEQQPKLFVAKDFKYLSDILNDFASTMAYKVGKRESVEKAIKAKTVCTLEIDKKIQISGKVEKIYGKNMDYINLSGHVQISQKNKEISGHGIERHPNGYGFPIGKLKNFNSDDDFFSSLAIQKSINLEFNSGVLIKGILKSINQISSKISIVTINDCAVTHNDEILFSPDWGEYDLILGEQITSVYGGPADIDKYYTLKNKYERISSNKTITSNSDTRLNKIYLQIRDFRNTGNKEYEILHSLFENLVNNYPKDWLAKIEIYEIISNKGLKWEEPLKTSIMRNLENAERELAQAIKNSIRLIEK